MTPPGVLPSTPQTHFIDGFQNSSCQNGFGSLIPWPTKTADSPPVACSTQSGGFGSVANCWSEAPRSPLAA